MIMKRYTALICAIIMIFVLVGCEEIPQNSNSNTGHSSDGHSQNETIPSTTLEIIYDVIYWAESVDEFLQEWDKAQNDSLNEFWYSELLRVEPDEAGVHRIVVPKLQSDEFILSSIQSFGGTVSFFYMPKDAEMSVFLHNVGIEVIWVKDRSFDELTSFNKVTNGCAYDERANQWFIDKDGACVIIDFPESVVITDSDELKRYFTFEWHSITN